MKVYLNGNTYELAEGTGVLRSPMIEWPDNMRLDGQQQRKDRRLLSSWVINDWSKGLGCNDIKIENTETLQKIWDAENVDTRNTRFILSPAFITCTINPSYGNLNLDLVHNRKVYLVQQGIANPTIGEIAKVCEFLPPNTFGSADNLMDVIGSYDDYSTGQAIAYGLSIGSIMGIKSLGNFILFQAYKNTPTIGVPGGDGIYKIAAIGASMFATIGGIPDTNLRYLGVASYGGALNIDRNVELADIGGTIHVLGHHQNNTSLWIIDALFSTISRSGSLADPVGTYLPAMINNGYTMYAQTSRGIYNFDNTPQVEVSTERSQELNGAMELYMNNLYFKNKLSTLEYDGVDISNAGYDKNDGLVPEKLGGVTSYCSSFKYLFASVKGATYSHILAMDNNKSWQYYARIPTPGLWVKKMFLSDAPDAIDRLWIIFGNYNYHGYFLNPIVNPLQAGTYSFAPTGHVTLPIYGGDLPEEQGAFYDTVYNFAGMGGRNIITSLYGINGNDPVTTLGVISTNSIQNMIGSPYGIEAKTIQPKFVLAGANSGTSPQVKQVIYHYLKDPDKRETFEFTIDVNKTADDRTNPKEAVIGSLAYEMSKRTLMPFWYDGIGTRYVKVIDMPAQEEIKNQIMMEGQREGLFRVVVGEII